jgi:hypothetical protein
VSTNTAPTPIDAHVLTLLAAGDENRTGHGPSVKGVGLARYAEATAPGRDLMEMDVISPPFHRRIMLAWCLETSGRGVTAACQ